MPITATAQDKTFTFPDGTSPEDMGLAIDEFFSQQGATSAPETTFGPPGQSQPPSEGMGFGELFTGAGRQTELTETLPEMRGILAGEDPSIMARLIPIIATTTDPAELAQIIENVSPNIVTTFNKDAQGNVFPILTNRKTGAVVQVNKPGLSRMDIQQGLTTAAAFTPAGRAATLPRMALAGAATQAGIETAQATEGGTFDPEDVAIAGAALPAGQVVSDVVGAGVRAAVKPVIDTSKKALQNIQAKKLLEEAAPDLDTLKSTAAALYKQVDDIGGRVPSNRYSGLASRIKRQLKDLGFDEGIHPKVASAVNRLESRVGQDVELSEIEVLRRVVGSAAKSNEPDERRIATAIIKSMDGFIDDLTEKSIIGAGKRARDVGPALKDARGIWARVRKTEMLDEAVRKGQEAASGPQQGIQAEFRKIVRNEKLRKMFSLEELSAIRTVSRGTTLSNTAKALGKFGVTDGQAVRMLIPAVGAALGASTGSGIVAVAVPAVGQVSQALATRLTRRGAEFANAVIRSGKNSKDIARAYMKHTPSKQRSADELSELFLTRGDIDFIDLQPLIKSSNSLISNAAFIAAGIKQAKEGGEDMLNPAVTEGATAAPAEFR